MERGMGKLGEFGAPDGRLLVAFDGEGVAMGCCCLRRIGRGRAR